MNQTTDPAKKVHTLILDTSPILLNTPSLSTLLSTATTLTTSSSVLRELRTEEARTRFESLYRPFVTIRDPRPESVKHVKAFARRTGDLAVLSETDLEVLGLAYEIEVERNGGDWRLRNTPGQKGVNGKPPVKTEGDTPHGENVSETRDGGGSLEETTEKLAGVSITELQVQGEVAENDTLSHTPESAQNRDSKVQEASNDTLQSTHESNIPADPAQTNSVESAEQETEDDTAHELPTNAESDSESDGWITASNLRKKQAQDESGASETTSKPQPILQVATMTGDFAMQNVLLQMNLNLLSTATCKRISHIRQTILRCHACFATTRDMTRQFCARCGKPTLTRVSSSTNDAGQVQLHLKQNFQWNNRGNVYSVPKPQAGSANGKWKGKESGGGKDGWGNGLILAEDQKEFVRAMAVAGQGRKKKERDLMDEDVLPGILTGERGNTGGSGTRVKIGAGRNVNSKSRR